MLYSACSSSYMRCYSLRVSRCSRGSLRCMILLFRASLSCVNPCFHFHVGGSQGSGDCRLVLFFFIPTVAPSLFDVRLMPLWLCLVCTIFAFPSFGRNAMRNHAHFSGARSPPVTCRRSRKYCMMSSICSISASSRSTSSRAALITGSAVISSSVTPHVVSSTNESPGLTFSSTPSIATNLMQSYFSSSAARIN
jgi:hypothetical protein